MAASQCPFSPIIPAIRQKISNLKVALPRNGGAQRAYASSISLHRFATTPICSMLRHGASIRRGEPTTIASARARESATFTRWLSSRNVRPRGASSAVEAVSEKITTAACWP